LRAIPLQVSEAAEQYKILTVCGPNGTGCFLASILGPVCPSPKLTDVAVCVEKFFNDRRDFGVWAASFGQVETETYRTMARTRRDTSLTKAEILRLIPDATQVNNALDLLVHLGVIRQERRNAYSIGGAMFKTWFQENFGLASSAALAQDAVSRGAVVNLSGLV
jgi:hypothetical protein